MFSLADTAEIVERAIKAKRKIKNAFLFILIPPLINISNNMYQDCY